jgi:photosystem II stability/assembly factor-like uncharacterized protein
METVNPALFNSMEWRLIGPHRGGRVVAVAGDPHDPMTFYFGACAGGLWKTTDGGTYWRNVTDGFLNVSAVGAVAVAGSDSNVIYVGTGEACLRANVCHGDGIYRSTDGGQTWAHLGLEDTHHVSRVRVHPQNPDLVYAAAMGHAYGPNEQRGVFRSTNGGRSWEKVLYKSPQAGAADLSLDPNNPRILFAAIYQTQRYAWTNVSGGPDSSLHRSTDGGDTWEDISNNPGMPKGLKGRMGVSVSPAKSGRIWAMIESQEGGLFRSDDGGDTWEIVSDDADIRGRPWYYSHVVADTQDPETVYIMEGGTYKSVDGGRNFSPVPMPHGDNHDLWIDPTNPRRMIEGNDGGACVTYNGGLSWSSIYNQPTGQFYHVVTDAQFPYRVYGAQQDNLTMSVPSRSRAGVIGAAELYQVAGGEAGFVAVNQDNANIVYSAHSGSTQLTRYDHSTGQAKDVDPWPEASRAMGAIDLKYRFAWTAPIVISPHDQKTIYATGNRIFRTRNEGDSWEIISPDLTRNDDSKLQASGGPITSEGGTAEIYCTVFAFAESAAMRGLLWAGSDDGLVHVSRDDGETWENVTPPEMGEWAMVASVEPSPHDAATAYVAAHRYRLDDARPYVFKTTDYGKTWSTITDGIPADDFARVVREDPARRGLLYAGTETGVYVSFDDGAKWQPLSLNLPVVPVHDLVVKDNDLVISTHGRAFWILDDVSPLRQITDEVAQGSNHLFEPGAAYRFPLYPGYVAPEYVANPQTGRYYQGPNPLVATYDQTVSPDGEVTRVYLDAGQNPPEGLLVRYYLAEAPEGAVSLTFLDGDGAEIVSYSSDADAPPRVRAGAGMNSFVWDLRHPGPTPIEGESQHGLSYNSMFAGPEAPPGTYQVRLDVDGHSYLQQFEIRADPRITTTPEEYQAQHALLSSIRDKVSETHEAVNRLRHVRAQVDEWEHRAAGSPAAEPVAEAATQIKDKLAEIEGELVMVRAPGNGRMSTRLNTKLASLSKVVSRADAGPTGQATTVFVEVSGQIDTQLVSLEQVIDEDVALFSNLLTELEVPVINVPSAS